MKGARTVGGRSRACARVAAFASVVFTASGAQAAPPRAAFSHPVPRADGWRAAGLDGIRGLTIGPIENGYHRANGYGSGAFDGTLREGVAMGGNWIALTPFGRIADLKARGIDPSFEAPFAENVAHVKRAVAMAHARGMHVMLVPHLWVESGEWRGKIDPGSDDAWRAFAASYRRFLLAWAEVAEASQVEMLSTGVELRSWVTSPHAPSFDAIVRDVRGVYRGLLTYSSNWDDVDGTSILAGLDVIGINAFYPLALEDDGPESALLEGGAKVRAKVHALAESWGKPVMFTETGYTTRSNPAVKPWIWPEELGEVVVDEGAQAVAYRALLHSLLDEPDFAGFFVWRLYADPDDVSQEAGWGFSPRGKLSELVVRDAFTTRWAADGSDIVRPLGPGATRAWVPGWTSLPW